MRGRDASRARFRSRNIAERWSMRDSPTPTSRFTPPRLCPAWTGRLEAPTSEHGNRPLSRNRVEARQRDSSRRGIRADALFLRALQDRKHRVADAGKSGGENLLRPAQLFKA